MKLCYCKPSLLSVGLCVALALAGLLVQSPCVEGFVQPISTSNSHSRSRIFQTASSSSSLYAQSSNSRTEGKNQDEELLRLAQQMKVSIPTLKETLAQHREKLETGSEKAEFIDWVLKPAAPTPPKAKPRPVAPKDVAKPQPPRASVEEQTRQAEALQDIDPSVGTNVKFADRTDLHPASKRAILEVLGLQTMTEIQAKTFAVASSGTDVLGRARTGTGKTLAFLIPAVEQVLQSPTYQPGHNIGCLVISPTRELATQIADQAEKLLTFHSGMTVQVMYGGTKRPRDVSILTNRLPTILVATPGRLLDHLQETKIKGRRFGKDIMSETPIVVLDETDRLLDMGFRNEIRKIFSYMARPEKRQTLLFSATIPKDLKSVMAETMRPDYVEVDCIQDGDGASHTNERVTQSHVILPNIDRYMSSVLEIILRDMREDPEQHKIVVFFSTARMVAFFAEFFKQGLNIPVFEIHSKKTQSNRNNASEKFRAAKRGILFTSDVSARGVDYPDVTKVIQVGLPDSKETYIHRLGRTGRAGKAGQGLLVLSPFESLFLSELKGLDVPRDDAIMEILNQPVDPETSEMMESVLNRIRRGDTKLNASAQGAYQAFLGFYLSQLKRMSVNSKPELVSIANNFARTMGLDETPKIPKRTAGKMGVAGVPGIVIGEPDHLKKGPRSEHLDGRKAPPGRGGPNNNNRR
jgi:ATP-dependent RNA helicase MSS116